MKKITTVHVEISGVCNGKCLYCAQYRLKKSKQFGSVMSFQCFERVLERLLAIDLLGPQSRRIVELYNWGEPFLNSSINEILRLIAQKGMLAGISSNFIVRPCIDIENYRVLNNVTFSLSGFNQDSYSKIHGGDLSKTLENFEMFYEKSRKYSPNTKIVVAWHRYRFNEDQFWSVYRYFDRPGISFSPSVAFLSDLPEMLTFLKDELDAERLHDAQQDIFIEHMLKGISYFKGKLKNYYCPAWDYLVVDEIGQLLLCCGTTRYDSNYVLGNILEMSIDDIWQRKCNKSICKDCVSSGLAPWLYNQSMYNNRMKWPAGGGAKRLKLWYQKLSIPYLLVSMLRRLPKNEYAYNVIRWFYRKLF